MPEESLDRMGAFDAVMWGIEEDPILRSVVIAVVVLDTEPDVETLIERVTRMSLAVPRLRQRVLGNPVAPLPPRWELDPDFEIGHHLKRYHVQADGTFDPVLQIAEQMAEQEFDRARPLWEMALVQGFDGERAAVVTKLHHAITDGVGGVAMAAAMFDLARTSTPDLGPMPRPPRPEAHGPVGRLATGVHVTRRVVDRGLALAQQAVELSARAVTHPVDTAVAGSQFAQSAARLLQPASEPLSPLMHGRSPASELRVLQVPLQALRGAGRAGGGTLNDAFVAAVAGGVARYHEDHNAPAAQVRVNMPVDVRTGRDMSAGSRWVPARFPLPIDSGDPVARMHALVPLLRQARDEPALALSDTFHRLLTALPQSVTSISAAMLKGCDLAITTIPGPPIPLFAAGAEALGIVPFAPRVGAAASIALMSYHGTAFVGLNIDTRAIPDPEQFAASLAAGFDSVLAVVDTAARTEVGLHSGAPPEEPIAAPPG